MTYLTADHKADRGDKDDARALATSAASVLETTDGARL